MTETSSSVTERPARLPRRSSLVLARSWRTRYGPRADALPGVIEDPQACADGNRWMHVRFSNGNLFVD